MPFYDWASVETMNVFREIIKRNVASFTTCPQKSNWKPSFVIRVYFDWSVFQWFSLFKKEISSGSCAQKKAGRGQKTSYQYCLLLTFPLLCFRAMPLSQVLKHILAVSLPWMLFMGVSGSPWVAPQTNCTVSASRLEIMTEASSAAVWPVAHYWSAAISLCPQSEQWEQRDQPTV